MPPPEQPPEQRQPVVSYEEHMRRTLAKFGALTPEQIAMISVLLELPTPERSGSDGEAA